MVKFIKNRTIYFLVKRWEHHSSSGGYDRLANYNSAKIIYAPREISRTIVNRIIAKLYYQFNTEPKWLIDYRYQDWISELKALCISWFPPKKIFHVLYGDEQLNLLLKKRKLLNAPLAVSFHLPKERVKDRLDNDLFLTKNNIDAIVVLSSIEVDFFKSYFGEEKVFFIPHGIDSTIFKPITTKYYNQDDLTFLIVGVHMRDWDLIDSVIIESHKQTLNVKFKVVIKSRDWSHFSNINTVEYFENLTENELIGLYQNSSVLFCPVTYATANNSILEALSCGLPVISSSVGGITDYADTNCGWLLNGNRIEDVLTIINNIIDSPTILEEKSKNARIKALEFDWVNIKKKMNPVYQAALENYRKLR